MAPLPGGPFRFVQCGPLNAGARPKDGDGLLEVFLNPFFGDLCFAIEDAQTTIGAHSRPQASWRRMLLSQPPLQASPRRIDADSMIWTYSDRSRAADKAKKATLKEYTQVTFEDVDRKVQTASNRLEFDIRADVYWRDVKLGCEVRNVRLRIR